MKRAIFIILLTAAAMIFFACSENTSTAPEFSQNDQFANSFAKKPAPSFTGSVELIFSLESPPIFWNGTITFEEDGVEKQVGIRFMSLSKTDRGKTSHFTEIFYIYDLNNPDYVYMQGPDAGSLSPRAYNGGSLNGVVEEVNAPYEEWLGRRFHFKADEITWVIEGALPATCTGTVRIN